MSSAHWERLQRLFEGALAQPEFERESWLRAACDDDPALYEEVCELLAADAADGDPMRQVVKQSMQDLEGSTMPDQGQSIGPWRILREIGRGGMGSVYLAERADAEYERQVAVKLIRGFPDSQSLERMRAERQILANLDHPNIAAMIDGGTTEDGQPYLIMQYIDGDQLDVWCREHHPSRERRLGLMMQLCEAVEYAHRNLVIHRDLKPGNVLVVEGDQPVVLDFGIAKLSRAEADDGQAEAGAVTRSGRYYTPGFSPPEQLRGDPVTTLADVYSLGKLLDWLLRTHASGDDVLLPRELSAIVDQATASLPEDRYSSVTALREDLDRYEQGLPVAAAPARFGYRFGKFLRRHRLAASAAMLALLVGVGLVSRIVIESDRARAAEAEARLEAANANQVLDFLVDMIDAAGPARARGEPVEVIDVIELAREQTTAETIDDPALRARLLFALGRLYRTVESHAPATELLAESARLAQKTGELRTEIEALAMLGVNLVLNDEVEQGREPLERAIALVEAHPELDPLLRATALNNYGIYLNESNRSEEARHILERALGLRRAADAPLRTIATSLHNLGEAEDLSGRPAEAREYYRQALALKERSIGRLHLSYAASLNGLSMVSGQLSDYETAREAMEEHLEIRQILLGEDHHSLWRPYNELAWQAHDAGRLMEAMEYYLLASEHDQRSPGGPARDWLFSNNLGAVYRDLGLYERAEAQYRESLALRSVRFGDDNLTTHRARHNLATALYLQGRLDEARQPIEAALAARRAGHEAGHPDILRSEILAELIALAQASNHEGLANLSRLIEQMAEALSDNNFGVLQARAQFGRALIDAGQLDAARAEIEDVRRRLVEALNPEHAFALALELDLARIEMKQGLHEIARERLADRRLRIQQVFPVESAFRELLEALLNSCPDLLDSDECRRL